jgi:hypothetical protein
MGDAALRKKLVRLAFVKPELRPCLLPLIFRQADGDEREAGRPWNKGQRYGPKYKVWEFKKKTDAPKNPGTENCYYKTRDPKDRGKCYKKKDVGVKTKFKGDNSAYNKAYREKYMKRVKKAEDLALRKGLLRLAYERPELRSHLVPLLAGRGWGGESSRLPYGPGYTPGIDPVKPPTNRGPGKCFYQTGDENDRCYDKRNIPSTGGQAEYNKKYRRKVYNLPS